SLLVAHPSTAATYTLSLHDALPISPFQAGRKARATAPFQTSVFYLINDFVRRQPGQRLTRAFVTVFAAIFVQPHWLFVIAQTPGQRMRFGSTDNVFHLYRSSSSGIASGVRCARSEERRVGDVCSFMWWVGVACWVEWLY